MFYTFAKSVVHLILVVIGGRFQVQNKDKITDAPFVLVSPHSSWIEIIYLGIALHPQQIYFMAKQELFKNKLFGWVLKHLNAFPVNREKPGPSSLKAPIRILRSGKVIGIFPSGTRKTNNVHLKRGAVTIAYKAKVPLQPAVYAGPKKLKEVFRRKKVIIRFGDPIYLNDSDKEQKEILEYKSNQLLETFTSLQREIEATKNKVN